LVQVHAPNAANSPQVLTVVLQVLASPTFANLMAYRLRDSFSHPSVRTFRLTAALEGG